MTEEEHLDEIFDSVKKWKGQKISWCELCNTFSIGCPKNCSGSSCNAGGCPECAEIHADFHKAKTTIWNYLSTEENKIYDKIISLKKYMLESLARGEYEINWKRMYETGQLCERDLTTFAAELKDKDQWKKYE